MKLIKREGKVLTVEHRPNMLGRLLKKPNYEKKYFHGIKDYCFYNCFVWYDCETGEEVGTNLSMKLQPLYRLSHVPRVPLKPNDIIEEGLFKDLTSEL